ncbi:TetR family transcriptional regulator [Ectothiorhodospira haloalkaliphila]|uniref:TetR family transcriptional regulator n=2 Tax=Ectothiorhodospiraceae TaxID=72276 RepID=W8KGW9_9GAMM|nr:TetR family transcriptional regulator [Ectothiorhodospira haloalkaliphila]
MMRRTKEQAEQTRQQLLDAAERMFLKKGVSGTTLANIAEEAGLTRGAIYWHFQDKDDLYNAMVRRVVFPLEAIDAAYARDVGCDPVAALEKVCLSGITHLLTDARARRVYTIVLHRQERCPGEPQPAGEVEKRQQGEELFRHCFESVERAGRLHPLLSVDAAVDGLMAFFTGLIYRWLLEAGSMNMADQARPLFRVFLEGMIRPASRP